MFWIIAIVCLGAYVFIDRAQYKVNEINDPDHLYHRKRINPILGLIMIAGALWLYAQVTH